MMEEARSMGVEVACDQYPYNAGSTLLSALAPPKFLADGLEELSLKLKGAEFRKRVVQAIEMDSGGDWENFIKSTGFENIMISSSPSRPEYIGSSIARIAEAEKKNTYDVFFDLLMADKAGALVILFVMGDEDIHRIMQSPLTMIGTDGIPATGSSKVHPRMTGTYPRILGRYVRENNVLSLEEAVRKMTSFPAQTFRMKRKGLLVEGFDADLIIFDPETIIDRSTYEEPDNKPEGIRFVLVNGHISLEDGVLTGAASGKVLRRGE